MTALADREWRVIGPETRDGPTNMALDEVAARTAAEGGPRTVRVYGWDPSTLSLGYAQDAETIDWDYCEREGVSVTRRQTGGGAIYHDGHGDVSYSIVTPADEVPGDLLEAYELLCEPVLAAFADLGVDAGFADDARPAAHRPACYLRELHPAHDVVGPEGGKISGNAQYRRRDAVVQHGSLTVERAPERHCGVFAADIDPATFTDRVTSIAEHADAGPADVRRVLADRLATWADARAGEWTDDELDAAEALVAEKYGADAWIRDAELPD